MELDMNNKGISILEVLVSMIVLSVGLLGVAPMVVLSVKSNSTSRDTSETSKLVREQIEYYEAMDSLPTVPYEFSERSIDNKYDINVMIQNNSSDADIPEGLFEIMVTINWEDETNLPKMTTYSTYLRKGAIHVYN